MLTANLVNVFYHVVKENVTRFHPLGAGIERDRYPSSASPSRFNSAFEKK